jgi:hypothetical protein
VPSNGRAAAAGTKVEPYRKDGSGGMVRAACFTMPVKGIRKYGEFIRNCGEFRIVFWGPVCFNSAAEKAIAILILGVLKRFLNANAGLVRKSPF